jgi:hypothetical protein
LTLRRTQIASAGGLIGIAIAAIAYFDLQTTLAFNDDYIYSWSARHLVSGVLYPRQTALALPQIVAGWLVSWPFGHDQRALRLSVLIVIAGGAWAAFRTARRLGAGTAWSLLAPAIIITSPIFFNLAVSFMSDVALVGLLLLACESGVAWLEGDGGKATFALWATLSTLQRFVGVGVAPCLAIALWIRWRRTGRGLERADATWLAVALASSFAAALAPGLLGVSGGLDVVDRIRHIDVEAVLTPLIHLPVISGYLLLPLALAISVRWSVRLAVVAAVGAALVVAVLLGFQWLPGNIWTYTGPAPSLPGVKPPPIPLLVEAILIAFSAVAFWMLGVAGSMRWLAAAADSRYSFLLLVSGVQLLILLPNTVSFYDRYYLPVITPVVPMLAALAQSIGRPGATPFAAAACGLLLVLSIIYEQDYESWQLARDRAANLAYRCAPPAQVAAGYEANAVYVEIPTYEATGHVAPPRVAGRDVTVFGPADPAVWLLFALPDDSRPGVAYRSSAPGKIVIIGSGCPAAFDGGG